MQEADAVKKEAEVWLVFGWKVGQAALKKAITDMPPEEMESMDGLRVIVSTNGQEALLGKVLASGPFVNGMASLGESISEHYALERTQLTKKLQEIGFGDLVTGKPSYWFAGG